MTAKQLADVRYKPWFNYSIAILWGIVFLAILYTSPEFQAVNKFILLLAYLIGFCAVWLKIVIFFIPVWFMLWVFEKIKTKNEETNNEI